MTKDHVPPKGLFPPSQRKDLITVPCCEACRVPTGLDDEYLKVILSFRYEVGDGPAADELRAEASKALWRPEQKRLRDSLLGNLRLGDIRSESGLILGHRAAYQVDLRRVSTVLARTVRGLFRRCAGRTLPLDASVVAIPREYLRFPEAATRDHWVNCTRPALDKAREHVIADGAFVYRHTFLDPDQPFSTWWLRFYGRLDFYAFTAGAEERTSD